MKWFWDNLRAVKANDVPEFIIEKSWVFMIGDPSAIIGFAFPAMGMCGSLFFITKEKIGHIVT